MSHPDPLLADYVDGSLDPSTRAEVDAHLRGCATCRAEVSLARVGAEGAQGLADPAPPSGIAEAAIAEAARLAAERNPEVTPIAGRRRRRPATPRVLAAAGAAALLLLVVLVAPKLGQNNTSSTSRAAAGAAATTGSYPSATTVELQHADYSFEALPSFAAALRTTLSATGGVMDTAGSQATAGSETAPTPTQMPAVSGAATDVGVDASRLPSATECLDRAFHPAGTLSRVILARFKGEPAYLGVYLIGPGAELPPTLLQLNVASVHGCNPVGQTTARL
jgi:Putative zinc-finger